MPLVSRPAGGTSTSRRVRKRSALRGRDVAPALIEDLRHEIERASLAGQRLREDGVSLRARRIAREELARVALFRAALAAIGVDRGAEAHAPRRDGRHAHAAVRGRERLIEPSHRAEDVREIRPRVGEAGIELGRALERDARVLERPR